MERATHAIINLQNLRENVTLLRKAAGPDAKFTAVIKANAYGHGIVEVAKCLEKEKVDFFAVALMEEGILLRENGITTPILILGITPDAQLVHVIENDLIPTIASLDSLREANQVAASLGMTCLFHLKIDTGMNRIGIKTQEELNTILDALPELPHVSLAGVFTHFANSEDPASDYCREQMDLFQSFVHTIRERGYSPIVHASNSGAVLYHPECVFDMVRCGISMYGYNPRGVPDPSVPLKPVLQLVTKVSFVKHVPENSTISYGRTFTTARDSVIATLPIGYGDGYMRSLSRKASVLIHGKRAPIVGTICMDQLLVDVTDIPGVTCGDEAVMIGKQENEEITADELADLAGTISYEILLEINDRVPRIYTNI